MLDSGMLVRGIDALARAHQFNFFTDGHRAAAILSAVYFCRENAVEPGVAEHIETMLHRHWSGTPLCEPLPRERSAPTQLERLIGVLADNIVHYRMVGHNVIFGSLALKVFKEYPEFITVGRIDGICRLIESFDSFEEFPVTSDVPDLDFSRPGVAADLILGEGLEAMNVFEGRGQGWTGHLMTYGRAMLDLAELGYSGLVDRGHDAFGQYLRRLRMGPRERDRPRPEHSPSDLHPLQSAYWARRGLDNVGIGHCFKYPYGFFGIMERAENVPLKQRAMARGFRIF